MINGKLPVVPFRLREKHLKPKSVLDDSLALGSTRLCSRFWHGNYSWVTVLELGWWRRPRRRRLCHTQSLFRIRFLMNLRLGACTHMCRRSLTTPSSSKSSRGSDNVTKKKLKIISNCAMTSHYSNVEASKLMTRVVMPFSMKPDKTEEHFLLVQPRLLLCFHARQLAKPKPAPIPANRPRAS